MPEAPIRSSQTAGNDAGVLPVKEVPVSADARCTPGRSDAPSFSRTDQDQTLVVAGVGTLYFGEVVVKPGERSVTMLRIEFEAQHPIRHLTIGTLDTNGTDMFP